MIHFINFNKKLLVSSLRILIGIFILLTVVLLSTKFPSNAVNNIFFMIYGAIVFYLIEGFIVYYVLYLRKSRGDEV